MKCSHCAVANMPGANFCQGCGQPLSASIDPGVSPQTEQAAQADTAQAPQQFLCFRCSAPLAANAKVCEQCGLNVENFKPAAQQQAYSRKTAGLAEVTFFTQPQAPDPQVLAFKTYAGWFAAVVFACIASFTAYSWLEASNVISRLVGGESADAPADIFQSGETIRPEEAIESPATAKLDGNDMQNVAASDTTYSDPEIVKEILPEAAALTRSSKPAPAKPMAATVRPAAENTFEQSFELQTVEEPVDSSEQAFAPEATPVQSELAVPQVEAIPPKPRKRVVVTQIEPNKQSGPATPRNEIEDFFRAWKKSIKQGVTERPCTQQERALNQCN